MQENLSKVKIWVDADACPGMIKEVIFKASFRLQVPVCLVANSYVQVPSDNLITSIQVEKGADVADFYIIKKITENDMVITADIPLAALVVAKGAVALNPRGEIYTEKNVRERLSVRDFMQDLRDGGIHTGGPPPFGIKDKIKFSNSFNALLTKIIKKAN